MNETAGGQIEQVEGGYVIRFERRFDSPVSEVWSALTVADRLKQWMGAGELELDLRPGGRMVSRTSGPPELVEAILREGGSLETSDTVLRVEPERVFEHTFGGSETSVVRWELSEDGGGCLLRLTHTEKTDTEGTQRASFLAGWHDLLDALGDLLAGRTPASTGNPMERWERYKERYERELGEAAGR